MSGYGNDDSYGSGSMLSNNIFLQLFRSMSD